MMFLYLSASFQLSNSCSSYSYRGYLFTYAVPRGSSRFNFGRIGEAFFSNSVVTTIQAVRFSAFNSTKV